MNPIPFTWMLIAFLGCFGSGAVTGGIAVYKLWSYSAMKAQIAQLRQDNKNFRTALGFSEEIDDENIKVEIGNEEIQRAILSKAPKEVIVQRRWFQRLCPPPAASVPDPVCVDADIMRAIGSLK